MKRGEKTNVSFFGSIGKRVTEANVRLSAFKTSVHAIGRRRALTPLTVWCLVAILLFQMLTAPMAFAFQRERGSSGPGIRHTVIPPLADVPFTMNARAYKTQLLQNLYPLADSAPSEPGKGRGRDNRVSNASPHISRTLLDTIAQDVATRYIDGARLASAADARAVFRNDLQLAARLSSLLTVNKAVYRDRRRLVPLIVYAPVLSSALSDLLLAGR